MDSIYHELAEDARRRARMTPLEKAEDAVVRQQTNVRSIKTDLKSAMRVLRERRAEVTRIRKEMGR